VAWAVSWRPAAERDLTDCAGYIAEDSIDAALRFIDAVEGTIAAIAENPFIGIENPFAHPELAGMRRLPVNRFHNYLIFYRPSAAAQTAELVRILHGARDLPDTLLGDE
jgi:plasmid stabilization system protein ParE